MERNPVKRLTLAVGLVVLAGTAAPEVVAETPAEVPEAASEDAGRPRRIKNLFLPLVPREEQPAPDRRDTAPVIDDSPRAAPVPPPKDMSRPEDAMFVTGIVRDGDEVRVLVEDRRTGKAMFLKKGDALGEGVIVEIGKYDITVKEWTVTRKIPLGYSVSGKRDTYVPPPTRVSPGGTSSGGSASGAPGEHRPVRLPPWPGREVWKRWSPEQRREYLKRRREAFLRLRQERHRRRR